MYLSKEKLFLGNVPGNIFPGWKNCSRNIPRNIPRKFRKNFPTFQPGLQGKVVPRRSLYIPRKNVDIGKNFPTFPGNVPEHS